LGGYARLTKTHPAPQASLAPPLWRQLQAVAALLLAVRSGQSTTTALAQTQAALRPGVQALGFAVLRQLGTAQALRDLLVKKPPAREADALLCAALALALGADYDAHTLVNQTVEAAKHSAATRGQAPFINACLRRFLRERDALLAQVQTLPQARWNHPRWWVEQLQRDHPEHWQHILQANNTQAPLTLRIHIQKQPIARYLTALAAMNIIAIQNGAQGLSVRQTQAVSALPGYVEGWFSVQDAAAQLAAPLLLQGLASAGARLRLLDACAAPGGKTAHLLELAPNADVLALDIDSPRCARIHENLQRLGLSATVQAADAANPQDWWDGQAFDGILLDAPCTASGIVRRHPDVRWLRRKSDIAQLSRQQHLLLQKLWPLLRVGGRLVYCTCSVFRQEGAGQIETFLRNNSDALLLPSPGHLLPQSASEAGQLPHNGLHDWEPTDRDGFFYAVLQKT
jgi:16S rRNA (cytosine967-C5)-methyltransferase